MKVALGAMAIILLAVAPSGPAMAKGRRGQQAAPKAEDVAKRKAAEDAYENALKGIPASTVKTDPWQNIR